MAGLSTGKLEFRVPAVRYSAEWIKAVRSASGPGLAIQQTAPRYARFLLLQIALKLESDGPSACVLAAGPGP